MEQQGRFILCTIDEFSNWMNQARVARSIRLLQNHHTYIPGYAHFKGNNHFSMLRGMEAGHLQRGFNEIAQNLTTFPDGKIAICRSLDKIPAGIKGANQGGICMEHIGNFDKGGDQMTPEHRDCILRLNALLLKKFSLPANTDTVVYHHWWDLNTGIRTNGSGATKSCPGINFFGGNTLQAAQEHFIPAIHALLVGPISPVAAFKRESEVSCATLNVRSLPGSSGIIIKTLKQGILVRVYEDKNDWCRIHPSAQHWVSARFLKPAGG
jgi:hypothetical protein